MRDLNTVGSNRVMHRTAEVRRRSPSHSPSTPSPMGVIAPTPVTTTRLPLFISPLRWISPFNVSMPRSPCCHRQPLPAHHPPPTPPTAHRSPLTAHRLPLTAHRSPSFHRPPDPRQRPRRDPVHEHRPDHP